MKNTFFLAIFIFTIISCKKSTYYVYSPDKKQCITIKDFYNERYIVIGKVNNIPDTNYVKLKTDPEIKMNDELAGCWSQTNSKLKLIINDALILENKMDTSKYIFLNKLPLNKNNIPTLNGFSENGCFHFGFTSFSVVPKNGAIIE